VFQTWNEWRKWIHWILARNRSRAGTVPLEPNEALLGGWVGSLHQILWSSGSAAARRLESKSATTEKEGEGTDQWGQAVSGREGGRRAGEWATLLGHEQANCARVGAGAGWAGEKRRPGGLFCWANTEGVVLLLILFLYYFQSHFQMKV